jgi:2-polyprenyl-6-hydroxyphenyl methylase/3-demethylubiquinone-9 3-methyltransferase
MHLNGITANNDATGEFAYETAAPNHSHQYLWPVVADFVRRMPPRSRILDLGCGNGSMLAAFCELGLELHGVDASKSGIAQARQHYASIVFHVADLTCLLPSTLPPRSFDAIISTEVIEHVFEPRCFARNAFDLLKPGGQCLITTPYHGYLKNLAMAVTGGMDRHFTALWDYGHIKFWSRRTLGVLLEEAGFQNLEFSGVGRLPWLWKSMAIRARKPPNPRVQA